MSLSKPKSSSKLAAQAATQSATANESEFSHQAVLLEEAVAAVLGVKSLPKASSDNSLQARGIYVDATFGRGGHSRLLLSQLADDAKLIVCLLYTSPSPRDS